MRTEAEIKNKLRELDTVGWYVDLRTGAEIEQRMRALRWVLEEEGDL